MKKLKIKKILVPVDFSKTASNALTQAIFIARLTGAKLKLVHIVSGEYAIPTNELNIPYGAAFYTKLQKSTLASLDKLAKNIQKEHGIETSTDVKSGVVSDAICAMAKKGKISLIVMGTHGMSGVKEFFTGSNAYKVINHAPCPVISVQQKPEQKIDSGIILPIRLEMNSREKVDYVVELAKVFGCKVYIVGFTSEKNKEHRFKIKQYVKQVEDYLTGIGIENKSTTIFADNFTKEIIQYAKTMNVGLIAIMNEHDFSIDQLVKGSYTQQFVNHSKVPVLSIPAVPIGEDVSSNLFASGDIPF